MTALFHIPSSADTVVSIDACSILEHCGTKVVHCSMTFDTDPHIVRPTSVFGQLLRQCADEGVDVDGQIDAWLDTIKDRGQQKDMLPYRKRSFASGEICPIRTDKGVVCLAGFCNTTNVFTTESVTLKDYMAYWDNLWHNLSMLTIDKSHVYVTVPGGKAVCIAGCTFDMEQSLGIILISYFRFVMHNTPFPHLHVCIGEDGERQVNLPAWENHLMNYLWRFASLPIRFDVLEMKVVNPMTEACCYASPEEKKNPLALLMDDLREMVSTAAKANGLVYEQYEGSKRVSVDVKIEADVLQKILNEVESHPKLTLYFGKAKDNGYDKNALLQLMGTLIERSSCFGELNRRSVMTLCLSDDGKWKSSLGDNKDNIINYVGQRLKTFKTQRRNVYDELVSVIPSEWCRPE